MSASVPFLFVITGIVESAGKKGCVSGIAESYGLNSWA